jgi:hypothetical protein
MMNEQSSPVVYGLFFEVEFKGQVLLGLYFLEGEAQAAREAYIAKRTSEIAFPNLRATEEHYLQAATFIRPLLIGQVASYDFAGF